MSGNRKKYGSPVMEYEGNFIIEDKRKAKLLPQILAKIQSTENVRNKEKEGWKRTILETAEVLQGEEESVNVINIEFSVAQLNNLLRKA